MKYQVLFPLKNTEKYLWVSTVSSAAVMIGTLRAVCTDVCVLILRISMVYTVTKQKNIKKRE